MRLTTSSEQAATQPAFAREYFVGVPAPAGAILALGPLAAKLQFGVGWW